MKKIAVAVLYVLILFGCGVKPPESHVFPHSIIVEAKYDTVWEKAYELFKRSTLPEEVADKEKGNIKSKKAPFPVGEAADCGTDERDPIFGVGMASIEMLLVKMDENKTEITVNLYAEMDYYRFEDDKKQGLPPTARIKCNSRGYIEQGWMKYIKTKAEESENPPDEIDY